MKLPVMLRETHEQELADLKRLLAMAEQAKADAHQAALDAMRLHELERRRYDDLFARYDALRVAGAVPKPDTVAIAKPEPDPVTQAILAKAGNSSALRKHFFDYVTMQRAAGTDDSEIAANILAGESLDPATDGVIG